MPNSSHMPLLVASLTFSTFFFLLPFIHFHTPCTHTHTHIADYGPAHTATARVCVCTNTDKKNSHALTPFTPRLPLGCTFPSKSVKSMRDLADSDSRHSSISTVCVCVCVCVWGGERLHHSDTTQSHTDIMLWGGCVHMCLSMHPWFRLSHF